MTQGLRSLTEVFQYHGSLAEGVSGERPWKLGAWRWATQGHMLVAVRDDGSPSDPTPEAFVKAAHYLTDDPADLSSPFAGEALARFAGDVQPPDDKCLDCEGDGRDPFGEPVTCEHCGQWTRRECHACGGDGLAGPEARYGSVAGIPINCVLLAFALTCVPREAVRVGRLDALRKDGRTSDWPALVVLGSDWRIVLMSVSPSAAEGAPVFHGPESAEAVDAVDPVEGIVSS